MTENKTDEAITENRFTKKQITDSKKYVHNRDLLNVLLDNSKEYTFLEVDSLIGDFMKGKVK